jgi:hypothetical protein
LPRLSLAALDGIAVKAYVSRSWLTVPGTI